MPYRICKVFRVENAHMLSKHPERCRFPHGHSLKIEVIVSASELNSDDMVCDFKALKMAVSEFIDSFDHALCVNSQDPMLKLFADQQRARLIVFDQKDPTSEVVAARIFDFIDQALRKEVVITGPDGKRVYSVGKNVKLDRVRVWETPNSWAEYQRD